MNTQSRRWAKTTVMMATATLVVAGCTQAGPTTSAATSAGAPAERSVSQVLQASPQFSDFTTVLSTAGLWHELNPKDGVTVLAPTNLAFSQSDPSWRTDMTEAAFSQGDATSLRRQDLVKTSEIAGVHPPSDFAGKLQDVQSLGGTVLHLDGRTPGVIKVSTGVVPTARFGKTASVPTGDIKLPPIQAFNGLVYSIDAITVHDQN